MEAWLPILLGGGGGAGLVAAWLVYKASKRRNTDLSLAERFDDASELAKYIREQVAEQVEAEVERRVAPIRKELQTIKAESHEMNDAVRAHVTQQWLWDQRGRPGSLPMLPAPILERLGLAHLHPDHHKE